MSWNRAYASKPITHFAANVSWMPAKKEAPFGYDVERNFERNTGGSWLDEV